jgi:hypothetical protein
VAVIGDVTRTGILRLNIQNLMIIFGARLT